MQGTVDGVIIFLYNHISEQRISDVKHKNTDLIKSYMHSHFHEQSSKCCETLIVSGKADRIRSLLYELESTRGVEEVQIFVV